MPTTHGSTIDIALLTIDDLIGDPIPDDWADPGAQAVRRDWLCAAAIHASLQTVELLVHNKLAVSGMTAGIGDPPVRAQARAVHALHLARCRYDRDTQRHDTLAVIRTAAELEVGEGVARDYDAPARPSGRDHHPGDARFVGATRSL
jgi:hypothetical protein